MDLSDNPYQWLAGRDLKSFYGASTWRAINLKGEFVEELCDTHIGSPCVCDGGSDDGGGKERKK